MKSKWGIALVLAMLIQPTSSRADFAYAGMGATSCGKIADGYRQNPTAIEGAMMSWAQGFMSGLNVKELANGQYRDLQAMTIEAQEQNLRSYCDEHPLAQLVKGVIDLYLKLPMKKYPKPSQAR